MDTSRLIGWIVFLAMAVMIFAVLIIALKLLAKQTKEDRVAMHYLKELQAVRERANRLHDDLDITLKQNHEYVCMIFEIATGKRDPKDVPAHLKKPETVKAAKDAAEHNGR